MIKSIKKDGETVSPGKLWSLKKEIFIYEYIEPYVKIFRSEKNNYNKWCYFDPFAGSGLFELEVGAQKTKYPGSPILAYSRNEKFPFSEYYFADGKKKNMEILSRRMKALFPQNTLNYRHALFSNSVKYFETLDELEDAVLAVIDPAGFSAIPFVDIQQILEFPTVDVFLTIITSGIQRNLDTEQSHDSLTSFFGDDSWQDLGHAENILDEYQKKLVKVSGKQVKKISIDMETQKIYDLLYISKNDTATRIMDDIASKLRQITLDDLKSTVSKQADDVTTLSIKSS